LMSARLIVRGCQIVELRHRRRHNICFVGCSRRGLRWLRRWQSLRLRFVNLKPATLLLKRQRREPTTPEETTLTATKAELPNNRPRRGNKPHPRTARTTDQIRGTLALGGRKPAAAEAK